MLAVLRMPQRTGLSHVQARPEDARPFREMRVDRHGQQQHAAGDDELRARAQAEQAEAVVDRADHERAEDGALHVAATAEQRRAADDRGGDRVQQDRAAARVGVDRAQARGEHDAADRRHERADREAGDLDPVDVDARAPRGLGVAADRVDVAPERVRRRTNVQKTRKKPTITSTHGMPRSWLETAVTIASAANRPADADERSASIGSVGQARLLPALTRANCTSAVERGTDDHEQPGDVVREEVVGEADRRSRSGGSRCRGCRSAAARRRSRPAGRPA